MASLPESVENFLHGKRIAVAGVSRTGKEAANAMFRKLCDSHHEALPVNPAAPVGVETPKPLRLQLFLMKTTLHLDFMFRHATKVAGFLSGETIRADSG